MPNLVIRTEKLSKTYDSEGIKTRALVDINLTIYQGEFVSIMGPSGSGKSTLMQILGFLDKPTEGKYFFNGKNVDSFSYDELARTRNEEVGFVFQSFNLLPRTSVWENVELPLLYKRVHEKNSKDRIFKSLQMVGMEHRKKYLSNQISGGEKQRVAIARALINDPKIIFADEPTGNLDSKTGTQVMKILQELNNKGHTIILVTHETFTAEHAKRIIDMKDGRIISNEPVINRRIARDGELLK